MMLTLVLLGGCGDRFPDYHYKMTIYVDTPDGEKAFWSVRQVRMIKRKTVQDSTGRRIDRELRGEAVVLDLPSGPVFALLTVPDGNSLGMDYGKKIAEAAILPHVSRNKLHDWRHGQDHAGDPLADDAAVFAEMAEIQGAKDLPHDRPNPDIYNTTPQALWPMFVAFRDVGDPMSVYQVTATDIGVKRITIEITKDEVTSGIRDRLPWLGKLEGHYLTGRSSALGSPYGLATDSFEAGRF